MIHFRTKREKANKDLYLRAHAGDRKALKRFYELGVHVWVAGKKVYDLDEMFGGFDADRLIREKLGRVE